MCSLGGLKVNLIKYSKRVFVSKLLTAEVPSVSIWKGVCVRKHEYAINELLEVVPKMNCLFKKQSLPCGH